MRFTIGDVLMIVARCVGRTACGETGADEETQQRHESGL